MYASFFGLRQDPFSIAPDPRYLFMSQRHREALAHLLYGLDGGGGFVLLTGEIGTGKTTVCRCFLEQIPAHCTLAYIVNPKLSAIELVQTMCEEFGIAPQDPATHSIKPWIDELNAFLLASHAQGRNCVLIIDEAQNLDAEVLEQLRLLTNLETNERKLLQIILIGQPELRFMLARPELEQLAQRVIARFHLDALSPPETAQYIAHRLAVAGWTGPAPFAPAALQHIHRITRGVPRRINLLCSRALLGAYAQGQHTVSRATVTQAAREVFDTASTPSTTPSRLPRIAGWTLGLALAGAATWRILTWPPHDTPQPTAQAPAPATPASQHPTQAASAATPAASAASAAQAPAAPPPPPSPPTLDAAGMTRIFATLPRNERSAWTTLAPLWKLPPSKTRGKKANADTLCQQWQSLDVQCFTSDRTSLAAIRQLNRPGLLTLVDSKGQTAYALLTGLTEQHATLTIQGTAYQVPIDTLTGWWRGEYATLWRSPPGYNASRGINQPPAVMDWLATQLAILPTPPGPPPPLPSSKGDSPLKAPLYRFQLSQGLTPDGRPGPMTFMQLSHALGQGEPRLSTPTTAPAASETPGAPTATATPTAPTSAPR